MVRFAWHVEDGLGAHVPPGALAKHNDSEISHATCSIEIAEDKEPLQAVFTLPADYLNHEQVRPVGVAIAHGDNASEWKGELLTELAISLAAQGHLVVRYHCKSSKEARRQRMYEQALDAAATSPYAGSVEGWVLAGVGSGARVAAAVARRCRGTIVGAVMLSYPLQEPMPVSGKAAGDDATPPTDSAAPLLALTPPTLFIKGDVDETCSTGLLAQLLLSGCMPSSDTRLLVVPYVDQHFRVGGDRGTPAPVVRQVTAAVGQFVAAAAAGSLAGCPLPRPTPQQAAEADGRQPPSWLATSRAAPHADATASAAAGAGAAAVVDGGGGVRDAVPAMRQPAEWQQSAAHDAGAAEAMQHEHGDPAGGPATDGSHHQAAGEPQREAVQPNTPASAAQNLPSMADLQQPPGGAEPDHAAPMQQDTPAARGEQATGTPGSTAQAAQHSRSPSDADMRHADGRGGSAATSSDYDSGAEELPHGRQEHGMDQRPPQAEQLQYGQQGQDFQVQQFDVQQQQQQQQQSSANVHDGLMQQLYQQQQAALLSQQQWRQLQMGQPAMLQSSMLTLQQSLAAQLLPGQQTSQPGPLEQGIGHSVPLTAQRQSGQPGPGDAQSIGQVPLEQIWGGSSSGGLLASFMNAHQQGGSSSPGNGPP